MPPAVRRKIALSEEIVEHAWLRSLDTCCSTGKCVCFWVFRAAIRFGNFCGPERGADAESLRGEMRCGQDVQYGSFGRGMGDSLNPRKDERTHQLQPQIGSTQAILCTADRWCCMCSCSTCVPLHSYVAMFKFFGVPFRLV